MNYKITGRYIYRNIGGEGVLVPIADGVCDMENVLILNQTSTFLWENIKELKNVNSNILSDILLKEYNVSNELAKKDAESFIEKMIEAKCLVLA